MNKHGHQDNPVNMNCTILKVCCTSADMKRNKNLPVAIKADKAKRTLRTSFHPTIISSDVFQQSQAVLTSTTLFHGFWVK